MSFRGAPAAGSYPVRDGVGPRLCCSAQTDGVRRRPGTIHRPTRSTTPVTSPGPTRSDRRSSWWCGRRAPRERTANWLSPKPGVSRPPTSTSKAGSFIGYTDSEGLVTDTSGQWRTLAAQGGNGMGTPWASGTGALSAAWTMTHKGFREQDRHRTRSPNQALNRFPTDRPQALAPTLAEATATHRFTLDSALTSGLRRLAEAAGGTLFGAPAVAGRWTAASRCASTTTLPRSTWRPSSGWPRRRRLLPAVPSGRCASAGTSDR